MSPAANYMAEEVTYEVGKFRTTEASFSAQKRPSMKSRRSSQPKSFNGMHRRRAKRIAW